MITALATLSLLFATPAADPVAAQVSVPYGDLNLNTAAGQTELDRRLARAVNEVCPTPDLRVLRQVSAFDACRQAARRSATQQRQIALATTGAPILLIGSSGR